jgi:hypothetical protein
MTLKVFAQDYGMIDEEWEAVPALPSEEASGDACSRSVALAEAQLDRIDPQIGVAYASDQMGR